MCHVECERGKSTTYDLIGEMRKLWLERTEDSIPGSLAHMLAETPYIPPLGENSRRFLEGARSILGGVA